MRISIFSFLFLTFLITSCKKVEFSKISSSFWNPKLATPLAHGELALNDLLVKMDTTGMIKSGTDGLLSIVTTTEFPSFNAATFVTLSDLEETIFLAPSQLSVIADATPPFNVIPNGQEISTGSTSTQIIDFPVDNGAELKTVNFKKGDMEIQLESDLKHDIELAIEFPDFLIGGQKIVDTIRLIYAFDNQPMKETIKISLDGAKVDFTNNNTSFNKVRVKANGKLIGTGETVSGTEHVNLSFGIKNLSFSEINGYFGNITVSNPVDSIDLNLISDFNIKQGVLALTNPSIKLDIENSFGFPLEIDLTKLYYKETANNTVYNMVRTPSSIKINYPNSSEKNTLKSTSVLINSSNTTNISNLISSVGKTFYIGTDAYANKNGKAGDPNNFILSTSKMNIRAEIEVPMEGYATGFTIADTIEASLENLDQFANSVLFRLEIDNGFPFDLDGSVYFLDDKMQPVKNSSNKLVDLIQTSGKLINSGEVDSNGKVTKSTNNIIDVVLGAENIPYLKTAKHIVISGSLETHDATTKKSIKLYDTYKLGFKIGVQAEAGINK
jgi:hypothetical protein